MEFPINRIRDSMSSLIGIFIEPRKVTQVYDSIRIFEQVLPHVPLHFFCGKGLKEYYTDKLAENHPSLVIHELDTNNLTFETYSDMMKSISFWKQFGSDVTHALTIQTDGCLCIDSPYKIDAFLEYDYVGGYAHQKWWWKETQGWHNYNAHQCFNGGFSLRKIKPMIEVLEKYPPQPTRGFSPNQPFQTYGEDLYFVCGLLRLKYCIGMDEFATKFCTHTRYTEPTFCIHRTAGYDDSNLQSCLEYCPDYKVFCTLTPDT